MADENRAGEADRVAHGTGSTEPKQAERDSFRPGETRGGGPGSGSDTSGGTGPGVAGAGQQSIESTTAALGDMEPSAGSGGATAAESAGDDNV